MGDTPDTDSEGDDLGDLEVWELLKVFAKLLEDTGGGRAVHQIDYQETPIEIVVAQVRARLEADGDLSLAQLLVGRVGRIEIVGVFLALLELAKQRVITLEQTHQYGPITARLRPADQRGHDLYETALAARLVAGATSPTDDTANPQPGDTLGLEGLLPTHADPTPPVGGADPVALTAGGDHSPADDSPVANAPPDDEVAASQAMFASDDDIDPDLLDEELAAIVVPEIDLDATLGLPTGTGPQSPSQPDPANRPGVPAEPPRPGRVRR